MELSQSVPPTGGTMGGTISAGHKTSTPLLKLVLLFLLQVRSHGACISGLIVPCTDTVAIVETPGGTQNVTIGEGHELSCVFVGYPPPTVNWTFNGLPADGTAFSHQQTHYIGPAGQVITRSHLSFVAHSLLFTGSYQCMAAAQTAAITVNVQGKHQPTLHACLPAAHIPHSLPTFSTSLPAHISSRIPCLPARIPCIPAHIPVPVFLCTVPAQIMVQPAQPGDGLTGSVVMSCVGYGVPLPTLTWKREGFLLPEQWSHTRHESIGGVGVVKSSLELCPLQEGTRNGLYSCEVQNDFAIDKSVPFRLCFIGQSHYRFIMHCFMLQYR